MSRTRITSRPLTRREAREAAAASTNRFVRTAGAMVIALGMVVGLKAGLHAEERRLDAVAAAQAAETLPPDALCRPDPETTVEAVAARIRGGLDGSAREAAIEAALKEQPRC